MPEEFAGLMGIAEKRSELGDGFTGAKIGSIDTIVANHGLGKAQAAMTATVMVERFGCKGLATAGTAGGLAGIRPLDVLIGTRLIQHDYGRSRGPGQLELYRPGIPPLPEYLSDQFALELPAAAAARYRKTVSKFEYACFGTFASGDTFVNDDATRTRLIDLGANAVDMECAAVAQVAEFYNLPWLVA